MRKATAIDFDGCICTNAFPGRLREMRNRRADLPNNLLAVETIV